MTTALLSNGGPPLRDDLTTPHHGASQAVRHSRMESSGGAFQDQKAMRAKLEWLIGLTYEEYVLVVILERGRYLSAGDAERIAQIVAKRGVRD